MTISLDLGCGETIRNPYQANQVIGLDIQDADLAIEPIPHPDDQHALPRPSPNSRAREGQRMNLMRNSNAIHVDFRDFKGLIPSNPKAVPCNIDMVFERKGYFFVGEWKRPSERISMGQEIMLKALARQNKFVVVLITGWQTEEETTVEEVTRITITGEYQSVGKSLEDLRQYLSMWYDFANVNGEFTFSV
jgi:hypothetical protein